MKGLHLFPKSERLHGKKAVDALFASPLKLLVFPYKIILNWNLEAEASGENKPRVLISVSKRIFKKAHDRNRVKRQIREAYRLLKKEFITSVQSRLSQNSQKKLDIGFIYIGKRHEASSFFQNKMKKALAEIVEKACSSID
jgi:ribonuclease P protein component